MKLLLSAGELVRVLCRLVRSERWLARDEASRLVAAGSAARGPKDGLLLRQPGREEHYATKFLRRAGWRPQLTAVFRGALKYSMYGPIKRRVVQAFAAVGGHDTDASRDYDYTDWKAVASFATAFSAMLT
jgi:Flavodoxin domain